MYLHFFRNMEFRSELLDVQRICLVYLTLALYVTGRFFRSMWINETSGTKMKSALPLAVITFALTLNGCTMAGALIGSSIDSEKPPTEEFYPPTVLSDLKKGTEIRLYLRGRTRRDVSYLRIIDSTGNPILEWSDGSGFPSSASVEVFLNEKKRSIPYAEIDSVAFVRRPTSTTTMFMIIGACLDAVAISYAITIARILDEGLFRPN